MPLHGRSNIGLHARRQVARQESCGDLLGRRLLGSDDINRRGNGLGITGFQQRFRGATSLFKIDLTDERDKIAEDRFARIGTH